MGLGHVPARILGREAELAAVAAAASAALSGSGSVVLVEGVAGIGKTRLMTHACEQGALAGMRVLTARAAEFEAGFAWGVVRQLSSRPCGPAAPARWPMTPRSWLLRP